MFIVADYASLTKDKLIDLIERTFQREGLHVMTETHFYFRKKKLKNFMHGRIKMYVMRWPFCWTTFLFDLAPSCIDK